MTAPAVGLCNDITEAVAMYAPQKLYLKPIAKVNISVQLPQIKSPGKSISNWEVMDKLKRMIIPDEFLTLKVLKSTLEFIRFEGEIENRSKVKVIIQRVDGKTIKLSGFSDALKVRAAEAKLAFPSRYDWDSFFRDAHNMDETKPGQRPDTIHLKDLPCRWFANRHSSDREKPSADVLRAVFETYGEVRDTDIPCLDPYRQEMASQKGATIQTFNYGQDLTFEAYIQYSEYVSFVRAMDALRGMKMVYKEDDKKAWATNIRVDFDKTCHLSDKAIKKRASERAKLKTLEKEREEKVKKEREEEERRKEEERLKNEEKAKKREVRRREREERRRQRWLQKQQEEEDRLLQERIALEERRILVAQRKLDTIRLLSALFDEIKVVKQRELLAEKERELEEERQREVAMEKRRRIEEEKAKLEMERKKKARLDDEEQRLRQKILRNMRRLQERHAEERREELRRKCGTTRLKSAVASVNKKSNTS